MSASAVQHPIVVDAAGGEYMESVIVTAWGAKPGDAVKAGDTIVTVETAKAATEIAAGRDGYLARIIHAAGSEAPVGAVLGYLSDDPPPAEAADAADAVPQQPVAEAARAPAMSRAAGRIIASPYARKLARQRGLDLNGVRGSGPAGRIKSRDLPAAETAPQRMVRGAHHPVVLLHGFGADQSIWRWVIPLLHIPNRIVTLDLPGHGASRRTAPESIAAMAAAVAEEIAALGLTDAHVIGHSLGGGVALALGAVAALRIHSLGLLAPAGLGAEIDGDFLAGLVSSATPQALQPWLDRMVRDASALPQNLAGALLWQRKQAGRDAEQLQLARTLFPGGRQEEVLSAHLRDLGIPVKLIWGKADRIIPAAQAMGAPGTVALHLLEGIGHVPQLECAGTVARLIDELVRSSVHQTSQEERT